MEALLGTSILITIVEIILILLIPIAIVGIWTEVSRIRKSVEYMEKLRVEDINRTATETAEIINLLKGNNQLLMMMKSNNAKENEKNQGEFMMDDAE